MPHIWLTTTAFVSGVKVLSIATADYVYVIGYLDKNWANSKMHDWRCCRVEAIDREQNLIVG